MSTTVIKIGMFVGMMILCTWLSLTLGDAISGLLH